MVKLTDRQREILSAAAARADGAAHFPVGLHKPAAIKVGTSLVARELLLEVRAKADMPVWRADDQGNTIGLVLTNAGREAIGAEVITSDGVAGQTEITADHRGNTMPKQRVEQAAPRQPRDGSKQAMVIALLSREDGATLDALVQATNWLPHTTRAALTGLRKRGFAIERAKDEAGATVYRIAQPSGAASA